MEMYQVNKANVTENKKIYKIKHREEDRNSKEPFVPLCYLRILSF